MGWPGAARRFHYHTHIHGLHSLHEGLPIYGAPIGVATLEPRKAQGRYPSSLVHTESEFHELRETPSYRACQTRVDKIQRPPRPTQKMARAFRPLPLPTPTHVPT